MPPMYYLCLAIMECSVLAMLYVYYALCHVLVFLVVAAFIRHVRYSKGRDKKEKGCLHGRPLPPTPGHKVRPELRCIAAGNCLQNRPRHETRTRRARRGVCGNMWQVESGT